MILKNDWCENIEQCLKIVQIKKCELSLLPAVSQELYYVVLKTKTKIETQEIMRPLLVSYAYFTMHVQENLLLSQKKQKKQGRQDEGMKLNGPVSEL